MAKREILRDPIEFAWLFTRASAKRSRQPSTATQALIEGKPNDPIRVSAEERLELREVVAGALESLTEEEVWIINALLFERLSLRQAGFILQIPKTTLARRRDKILKKLEKLLLKETLVKEYLNETRSRSEDMG
tara:strand:- start:715 stop:1116 length:402 start_codon:yes stop_codon:yes gene_type:complete